MTSLHICIVCEFVLQDSDRFWRVTPPARAALIAVLSEPGTELALTWQACGPVSACHLSTYMSTGTACACCSFPSEVSCHRASKVGVMTHPDKGLLFSQLHVMRA